jgi:hypothetical protein
MGKLEAATNLEAECLKQFYTFLVGKVHHLELSGFSCVVMPLFIPVKSGDRHKVLGEMETLLNDVFKPKGLQYDMSDLRWRHVGAYGDNAILYDLADLVVLDTASETTFVQDNIEHLKGRMQSEQETISNLNGAVLISDNEEFSR